MNAQELAVTVFAPSLDDERVAATTKLLTDFHLLVRSATALKRADTNAPAHLFSVVCENVFDDEHRGSLLDAAERIGVDVFVQTLDEASVTPRLFIFDMDSTLIQAEVIDELAALAGVEDRVAPITERAMRGEIDFRGALAQRVALLKGLDAQRVNGLKDRIRFSPGVEALMRGLRAAGCITAVVSGGFVFFGRHAQTKLGFKYLFCNELDIVNGRLSGKLSGQIVDAQRKKSALLEVAEREGIPLSQTVAVGDGANDLPMLAEAATGVAYRAKPIVRAAARYRLNFAHLDSLLYLLH